MFDRPVSPEDLQKSLLTLSTPDPLLQPATKDTYAAGALNGSPKLAAKPLSFKDVADRAIPTVSDADLRMDFVRTAADNTNRTGTYLDTKGQPQKLQGSVFDTFEGSMFGYGDHEYLAPVHKDATGNWVSDDTWNPIQGFMRKLDDAQVYQWLYPTYDTDGSPILKEFIGTKAEKKSAQIAALNTFGPPELEKGFWNSLAAGLSNTLLATDDLAAGFVKFGTQPARWFSKAVFLAQGDTPEVAEYYANGSEMAKAIDKWYKDTIEDSQQNDYTPAQQSDQRWSSDWWGGGIGATVGSLAQFGGIGRGIKLSVAAANLGSKKLGFELIKRETANALSTYGSSAIIGFGAGYNEAKTNGLSDNEAFAFALPVGLINTLIEARFGKTVDKWLLGNSDIIAKELFNETTGKILNEGATETVINKVVEKLSSRITKETLKDTAQNIGEEVSQEATGQLFRTAFNAFLDGPKGEGRFRESGLDTAALAEAGIFSLTTVPLSYQAARAQAQNYGYRPDRVIDQYVREGKGDQLVAGLDALLGKGIITQDQYREKKQRIADFSAIEKTIQKKKLNLSGLLRHEYVQFSLQAQDINRQKLAILDSEAEKLSDGGLDAKTIKKEVHQKLSALDKSLSGIETKLALYENPEFLALRRRNLQEVEQKLHTQNPFAVRPFFTSLASLFNRFGSQTQTATRTVAQLLKPGSVTNTKQPASSEPVIGVPEELKAVLTAIKAGNEDARMLLDAAWLNQNPIYLSDQFDEKDLAILSSAGVAIPVVEQTVSTEPPTPVPPDEEQQLPSQLLETGTEAVSATSVVHSPLEKKKQELFSELTSLSDVDVLRKAIARHQITPELAQQMDETPQALSYLRKEQQDLFDKLSQASTYPSAILLLNSPKSGGRYMRSIYTSFIEHNLTALTALQAKIASGQATAEERNTYATEQDRFFHVLLHERTHAVLDGELTKMHRAALGGDYAAQRSWMRLTDLATAAYHTLRLRKETKGLYFFSASIAGKYLSLTGDTKLQGSLEFVHEFFAEALSNQPFIHLLNSIRLDSKNPELRASLDQYYPYSDFPPLSTLWQEIVRAVQAVFSTLSDKLSLTNRSLLTETYGIASRLVTGTETLSVEEWTDPEENPVPEITASDIWSYAIYKLFSPNEHGVKLSDLPSEILSRMVVFNLPYEAGFDKKLQASLARAIDPLSVIDGSFKPVFFRTTSTYMISYQTYNGTTTPDTRRIFIDSYGNLTPINTNVENTDVPVDFSKPSVFQPFLSENQASPYFAEKRAVLQAFDQAHKENFAGKAWLSYDPLHQYVIGKGTPYERMVRGQVSVVYQFSDGTTASIGYTHDLSKIKLGRMLSAGHSIEVAVRVKAGALGSQLSILRNENGHILDIKNNRYAAKGYVLEGGVFPSVEVYYQQTSVPQTLNESLVNADPFTHDDPALEVPMKKPTLSEIEERNGFHEIYDSFAYDDATLTDDPVAARLQTNQKLIFRRARHRRAWFGVEENELYTYIEQMAYAIFEALKKEYIPDYGEQVARQIDFWGMGQETFYTWVSEVHKKVMDETIQSHSRQDGADWEGEGFNPITTISPLIRYDIERLMYTSSETGARRVMDFTDAADILYDSFSFATSLQEAMERLEAFATHPRYDAGTQNRAQAIYTHFKNYLENPAIPPLERDVFRKAIPSYLSQLGSYRRHEAIIFQPNEGSNGVRSFYPSQARESRKIKEQIARKIENYISFIRTQRQTGKPSTLQWLSANRIWGITSKDTQGTTQERFSAPHVFRLLNRYLNEDTLITGISSQVLFKSLSEKEKAWLSTYINPKTGMFYDEIGNDGYGKLVDKLTVYLQMVGLDDFPFDLLKREKIADNEQYVQTELERMRSALNEANALRWQKAAGSGMSTDQLDAFKKELLEERNRKYLRFRRELRDKTPLYRYQTVTFHRYQASKAGDKGSTVEKNAPLIEFALQLAHFAYVTIEKVADGDSEQSVASRLGELEELSEMILLSRQGMQTPSFYLDAAMGKRWTRKIRSYRDDLMVKLAENHDGLLSLYTKTPIYENNNVLKAISRSNTEPIDAYFAGIKSVDGLQGASYTDMDDADYIYSNLAGFVVMSDRYWHFDKTPSDKPGIYLYKLFKFSKENYLHEIEKIKEIEEKRNHRATLRFAEAFEPVYQTGNDGKFIYNDGKRLLDYYQVRDQLKRDELVEGADYVFEAGKYTKGRLHNRSLYWYSGSSTQTILTLLEKEATEFYDQLRKNNVRIPVSALFENEHNVYLTQRKAFEEGQLLELTENAAGYYETLLEAEQKRVVTDWYIHSTINQYHLEFLLQGDPLYYKDTIDVSKRMAGVYGPMQRHTLQGTFTLASLRDIDDGKTRMQFPVVTLDSTGVATITPAQVARKTNRSDAQGYVTETFARRLQEGYGSLSGFGQVFKPLLFGVQPQHLADARPSYLKLSLFVVPDPFQAANSDFYTAQPDILTFAQKMYDYTGADKVNVVLFESGIKVGMSHVSNYDDPVYKTQEMDLSMLGLQNNPKHLTDTDSDIAGMSQGKKILGNLSPEKAKVAYELEAHLLRKNVEQLLASFTGDGIKSLAYESLSARTHTTVVADLLLEGLSLDNPVFGLWIENLFQARFAKGVSYLRLPGNKLVNVSEVGLNRPQITEEKRRLYEKIGKWMGDRTLKWAGPRTVDELTEEQFYHYQRALNKGQQRENTDGYILERKSDGTWQPVIYPTEVLVPPSMGEIGERLLAIRIPTSGPQSIIPALIVGHLPAEMTSGNTIVSPLQGPGLLGFDFDVDGLFTWRRDGKAAMKRMFDIYYQVLTDAKNYTDITEPVDTKRFDTLLYDALESVDYNKDKLLGHESFTFSEHSVARQLEIRNLNKIGKKMIGISAVASNIYHVVSACRKVGKPIRILPVENRYVSISRSYRINGQPYREYQSHYTDMETGERVSIGPVMVTLINLSTDNAKEQKLHRLGLTLENAPIFFDMVLKGIDPRYVLYFLNQPLVKEYEKRLISQKRVSDSYKGNEPYRDIIAHYEEKIRLLKGAYTFSHPIFRDPSRKHDFDVAYDTLTHALATYVEKPTVLQSDAAYIETQLHILEKYRYASELSRITSQIASLIRLDSSYPKTFLDSANRYLQIQKAKEKTNLNDLLEENPIYQMHLDAVTGLLDSYSQVKLIALPVVFKAFFKIAQGLSMTHQKTLEDGLKNYLVQNLSAYNKSALSVAMTTYHFVDWSSRIIHELIHSAAYGNNAFLRLLTADISLQPDSDAIIQQHIKPSLMRTHLVGKEFSTDQLEAIRQAFLALPTAYTHAEFDEPIDIQRLLVANLLYTKGLGMGGFSFSQFLPKQIITELDELVRKVHGDISQHGRSSEYWPVLHAFFSQVVSQYSFLQRPIRSDELEWLRAIAKGQDATRINVSEPIRAKDAAFSEFFMRLSPYRGVRIPRRQGGYLLYVPLIQGEGMHKTYFLQQIPMPVQSFVQEFEQVAEQTLLRDSTFSDAVVAVSEQLSKKVVDLEDELENSLLREDMDTAEEKTIDIPSSQAVPTAFLLEETPPIPDILSYYEDVVGFAQRDTPMDLLQLSEKIVHYRFGELSSQIWGTTPTIDPHSVYDPSYLNFSVQPPRPYTYLEMVDELMGQYRQEETQLLELARQIREDNLLGLDASGNPVMSTDQLSTLHRHLAQNMNAVDGLSRKEFANVFRQVANELVNRRVQQHMTQAQLDPAILSKQQDMHRFSNFTTSIAETSAQQVALQAASRLIDTAKYLSDSETNKVVGKLRMLLSAVYKLHFASQSDGWHRKFRFWENHTRQNEPYLWLYEKDGKGEYTGRFIAEYIGKERNPAFVQMELLSQHPTAEGRLAKAKLELYHFLRVEGDQLLLDNQYTSIARDRAFMPHLGVTMEEAYAQEGLIGAYLVASGLTDYAEVLHKVEVDYNGQHKPLGEWKKELLDKKGSAGEQKRKADVFKRLLTDARRKVANRQSNLSAYEMEELESVESSFQTHARIPFRAVMRKTHFSINTSRILTQHFTQLIFKKYHDPILIELQATRMHYAMKSQNPIDFQNIQQFIELYGNRYFFGKKDAFSHSTAGKILETLSSVTVSSFLGLNGTGALLNAIGGLTDVYKHAIEHYGWAEGTTQFGIGMKRLLGDVKNRTFQGASETIPRLLFNPKALALAERFNVENFSQIDTEQEGSPTARFSKFLLQLQRSSEIAGRVASFLGELTEEQWNNYVLQADGSITVTNPAIAPTIEDVNRWKFYVSTKQGFYDPAQRYNYSYYGLAKGVMLFKNWILSFMKERLYFSASNAELNYASIDRYGKLRQGYWVTGALLAKEYLSQLITLRKTSLGRKLTELEIRNLRKLVFDVLVFTTIFTLGNLGDDDEEDGYWTRFANKLSAQLFFQFDLKQWVQTIKQPTPAIAVIENLLSALVNLATLKADKAAKNILSVTPGGELIESLQSGEEE